MMMFMALTHSVMTLIQTQIKILFCLCSLFLTDVVLVFCFYYDITTYTQNVCPGKGGGGV